MTSAIIVFSDMSWDFVQRRPQHLLSRLSADHPVIYVEEPVHDEGDAFLKTWRPAPGLVVCQPHTPAPVPGFHEGQRPYLRELLRRFMHEYEEHIAWFYTPMALPLLRELDPSLVVYDCVHEPVVSAGDTLGLQYESGLLTAADIVFTSGQRLYQARCLRHPNVHCLPSSVDVEHFRPAHDRANSHPAHREIPGPRLGFHGVIDECFDAKLIEKLADAHAMWQIVLVGPVVGIDPASLPQRANIHYLGRQPYEALPQFLAGWDVCLLPSMVNDATRCLMPGKILEYMAAELPIVSTPLPEVAEAYGDIVDIACDAPSFIAACEAALLAPPEEQARKVEKMRKLLATTSWDASVARMRTLLDVVPRRGIEWHGQESLRRTASAIIDAGPGAMPAAARILRPEMGDLGASGHAPFRIAAAE
jgi:glycosyltransferase involved in cell wall biosynthesis